MRENIKKIKYIAHLLFPGLLISKSRSPLTGQPIDK